MDHAQALELIETAAAEPGGLDRLMAGDTADAAALAGHLAACSACGRELARIRRTSETAREVIAATPDPALRERTLAYVRAIGRPRGDVAGRIAHATPAPSEATARGIESAGPDPRETVPRSPWRRGPLVLAWAASIAATALIALAAGGSLLTPSAGGTDPADALARVAVATLRVEGQPDAARVTLASPAGADTAGTLVYSPTSGELVVVATDLATPPGGTEYACWVETAEGRRRMGRMFFGGGIAYWAGPVTGLEAVRDGDRFGVSLVTLATDAPSVEPVLVGAL